MLNTAEFKKLTPGEQSLYNWQFQMHGGFFTALWKAISTADGYNLDRLALAFPSEVDAYRRYMGEVGWWERTLERVGRP